MTWLSSAGTAVKTQAHDIRPNMMTSAIVAQNCSNTIEKQAGATAGLRARIEPLDGPARSIEGFLAFALVKRSQVDPPFPGQPSSGCEDAVSPVG